MTMATPSPSVTPSTGPQLPDTIFSSYLLLVWVITLIFCWKVFPAILNSYVVSSNQTATPEVMEVSQDSPKAKSPPPNSSDSRMSSHFQSRSPNVKPLGSLEKITPSSSSKKLTSQLALEACAKAKEAGKHPSYTNLVLNLVHHYNLDVNRPVLTNSYTIFHCSCLSGSLELVSSLSPMADVHHLTSHGDSPLYLAVYSTAHRASKGWDQVQAGVEVVKHLLLAGCEVNQANLAGFTPLHQASRMNCPELVRLLMDCGADPKIGSLDNKPAGSRGTDSVMSKGGETVDMSVGSSMSMSTMNYSRAAKVDNKNMSVLGSKNLDTINRNSSVMTRSMTMKKRKEENEK